MKKRYIKPTIEVELYELNTAIATGCGTICNLGPGLETHDHLHDVCSDYVPDLGGGIRPFSLIDDSDDEGWVAGSHQEPIVANFYANSCSCYLSANSGTIFTS